MGLTKNWLFTLKTTTSTTAPLHKLNNDNNFSAIIDQIQYITETILTKLWKGQQEKQHEQ